MGGFFSTDGPIYRIGCILADIMILSLLWMICSIPIVTMGASTTALFYVTTKRVSENEGYVIQEFFKSFRANFKQSTFSWLALFVFNVIAITSLWLTLNGQVSESISFLAPIMAPVQMFVVLESFLITIYLFPIISRFELSFTTAFKTAFFMANKHIFSSVACIFSAVLCLLIVISMPTLVIVGMGSYAYMTSYLFVRIFKKYRPEMDARLDEFPAGND